jgi:hypothetical protein
MDKHRYDEMGLLIVKEDFCCEHFEPDDGALVPMKECWSCKWSNFRAENKNATSESYSVCNYVGNAKEAVNR